MNRINIDILGISEVRWKGTGTIHTSGKTFYFSCSDDTDPNHRHGVGILINDNLRASVKNFVPISERVILVQMLGKPVNINIIQAYAPTTDGSEEELEQFYQQLDQALKLTKTQEINIVLGDFNAKVGKGAVEHVVGCYGLGQRNERGERLIQYCQDRDLVITNTWYELPARRLYTWKSPLDGHQGIVRNQIDYVAINRRFKNTITKVTTLPGADVGSDHNPVVANIKVRLAKAKRKNTKKSLNIKNLKDANIKSVYKEQINHKFSRMSNTEDVEKSWANIKETFDNVNNTFLLQAKTTAKNKWMTSEILEMMEQRRLCKIRQDQTGYQDLHGKIRKEVIVAKETWMTELCSEAENLYKLGDSFHLHKKIKEISGIFTKNQVVGLKNDADELILDPQEILNTWKTYTANLFDDDRAKNSPHLGDQPNGPSILKTEVIHAINLMKSNKAPGPDKMYAETIQLLKEENLEIIVRLFNDIYNTGHIPGDWLRSTFIALPKSPHAKYCKDHRLISLMSHFLKLFLRILHTRLFRKCEEVSGWSQFGFKNGLGTREALFSMQTLIQNCLDQRKDVFLCFIDYEKAFDKVKHELLIKYLQEMGLDVKDIRIIANLYWNQTATICLQNHGETEEFEIRRGVRQGCILSPMLFNLYVERAFTEALADSEKGIKVNGTFINNIRYADDTAILADNIDDLQCLLNDINLASEALGLKINIKKTKVMIVSRNDYPNARIYLAGEEIERVKQFKYLGCLLNDKWDPETEIRSRVEQARNAFSKLRKFLTDRRLDFGLRYKMLKCYVWPVLLYGMEAWTLKVTSINKLEAFEMWTLRRMLRIPWTDRVRNEEVLNRAQLEDRQLFEYVKSRKTAYLGHILRGERYSFQQLILEGKIEGRRGIGRKKLSWLRNIRQWTGIRNYETLRNAARNREI